MADALVSPVVAGTLYACSALATGYSLKKVKMENQSYTIPLMGVMGAFVFATQMINFTIPGTGSSGHLCGSMLLSAVLGPYAGFLTMVAILAIQCLLFADGGLLALGCNIWNMGFYGCFVGGLIIWNAFARGGLTKGRITAASIIGCVVSLLLGAFSVTVETLASGITELPFVTFLGFMMPIHLVIGLVEGIITTAVLLFIFEARPQLLYGYENREDAKLKASTVVGIIAACALVIGGLMSLMASSHPDGLEWSIFKVTGADELEATGDAHAWAAQVQEQTALLPDYAISGSECFWGTSFSGIVGSLVVLAICVVIALIIRKSRHA